MGPPTLNRGVPNKIQKPRIANPPPPFFASVLWAHPIYQVLDIDLQELENGNMIEGVPLKKQKHHTKNQTYVQGTTYYTIKKTKNKDNNLPIA